MTETEARKAFNTASTELQTALTKYQRARTSLHRVTGEFVGTDQKLTLQFTSLCAVQKTNEANEANETTSARAVADC